MDTIKEILYIIGQALLFTLEQIWIGIKMLGDWLYKWLSDWVSRANFPTVMKIFGDVTANRALFIAIAAYIIFINARAVLLFKKDKTSAKRKQRRVSESKLIKTCLLGGATGGLIGMNVFHHKTKKKQFTVIVTLLFVIQLVLYSFALGFLGFWAFF